MTGRQALLPVFLLVLCLTAGCTLVQQDVVPPSITPVATENGVLLISHSFLFEEHEITLHIPVDAGVYYGAVASEKQILLYTDLEDREWLPIYYAAFITDPLQEPFFNELMQALWMIQQDLSLDDDRFLELCTVFVQSLPYDDDTTLVEPKYPIETFGDGTGDCDDKSLLLAGILSRAGYETALLLYLEEKHMAVGVRASGCVATEDGYAYIETTKPHFVGLYPERLEGDIVLSSQPIIIPVGEGEKRYDSCHETAAFSAILHFCRDQVDALNARMETESRELRELEEEIADLRSSMDLHLREGRYTEYNRQVPVFNAMIAEYNMRIDAYNELVREAERYVGIHAMILEQKHDRPGLYQRMKRDGILAEVY
ncbi:MAG: hypothetical protein D5R99_01875 [Methanocalculus sp. MSAO_Arc1]|uniref:hypothetical protein n=1 Tax=Methanocalculus TaxID=71151 RepID=UPI000FF6350C|nr:MULTISPECIES: hypothetical protein [unclassified Methanocalculus]MCP1662333.1 hypothetical protein [Methanocalculus sp. AMF5]RQD81516.1 MAG: hypothetical protein D5R99_01875 [Methanocalculus sp. MSAO_Arc1]